MINLEVSRIKESLLTACLSLEDYMNSIPEEIQIEATEFDNMFVIKTYRMTMDEKFNIEVLQARIAKYRTQLLQIKKDEVKSLTPKEIERAKLIDRFITMYPEQLLNDVNLEKMKNGETIPIINIETLECL